MYYFPWSKELDNEYVFYYNLNNGRHREKAKGRIVIRFSKDCIRFYWNNINYEDPLFPENQQLFAIDLSSSKTIGSDILAINQRKITKTKQTTLDENSIYDFIREFIAEIENDEGVFTSSSIVSGVRALLQNSKIYKLIAAKQEYEKYINEANILSLDTDEYNRLVSKYIDLLMSPKLYAILPPNKVGKNCLFENPEYELQQIIEKNISFQKSNDNTKKNGFPSFNSNINRKIQNFFLLKNSTISAYTNKYSRRIYIFLIILMAISSFLLIVNSCSYLSEYFFHNITLLRIVSFAIIISIGGILLLSICNNNFNLIFPRMLIALIASWMLILFSGDFVFLYLGIKNELIVYYVIIACILILFVLYYDSKRHSPYYKPFKHIKKAYNWKILPIFFMSIFFSLVMSFIIQWSMFQPLLKTGNILHSVIFSSEFKNVEHHITNTQLLIDNLNAYKREVCILPFHTLDSLEIHKNRVMQLNTIRKQLDEHFENITIKKALDSITDYKLHEKNKIIYSIDSLLPLLYDHIHTHQNFITTYYDTDTFLYLCNDKYRENIYESDTVIYNRFFLGNKIYQENNIVSIDKFYFFPKLLILHALIAVLIAFVIQIIFTGRSIIEPL